MTFNILFTEQSRKEFATLSRAEQKRIVVYLEERVQHHPFLHGKALTGNKKGFWRYRVGDYRMICQISNSHCTVLVLSIGHRNTIYE
jgi:mRNA interferase RelE/StbE